MLSSLEAIYDRAQGIVNEKGTIYRAHMTDHMEWGACSDCMAALAVWFVAGIEVCDTNDPHAGTERRTARWLVNKYLSSRG
jgi:hypothetical protein